VNKKVAARLPRAGTARRLSATHRISLSAASTAITAMQNSMKARKSPAIHEVVRAESHDLRYSRAGLTGP
jgi:hypothetical protein